ncbi:oligoendopeptidase F [Kurthia sibirica]|nr:oligoendopeptidase F [Kurthia sibirica]
MPQLLNRNEVNMEDTWNLGDLVPTAYKIDAHMDQLIIDAQVFERNFSSRLTSAQDVISCLKVYEELYERFVIYTTYARLRLDEDRGNGKAQLQQAKIGTAAASVMSALSFVDSDLAALPAAILQEAQHMDSTYITLIDNILRNKPYQLHPEVEKALATLSPVLDSPYAIYNTTKSVDMNFPDFEVAGTTYPMSYGAFENEWELEPDTDKRRAAFTAFSAKIADYQHTTAKVYNTQLQKEKTLASMKGFDSVIDALLHVQHVERDLYNRQIDLIMTELAPHMRRYAQLLKKTYGLDKMTYADLKIALDADFDPLVTKAEAQKYILHAVEPMGADYVQMVQEAFDHRWIDYAPNKGKSTGAFCSSPYGCHPYILVSWHDKMNDVFTLAHELGHAGHFVNAHKKQTIFNSRPSMYFIEAPSTMNEMLLANHLAQSNDDPRFKRWVISNMVSKTYFHNFVTHLLEAAYQRKVYTMIDEGQSVNAPILNDLFRQVLEEFWGEDVDITTGAELTWMRQPHYYMGLYSYTYSAGLTISTQVSQRIINGDDTVIADWLEVLQTGGTKTPAELALMAGVDVSTDEPLRQTIAHIGNLITELEQLTAVLEQ